MWLPKEDGVTHINVYSKGQTKLGRDLSNFAKTPFNFPPYGTFMSVEGFWYWLSTGQQYEELKEVYGWNAKQAGRELKTRHGAVAVSDFEETIKEALRCKLRQNKEIRLALKQSVLPLVHYYWYGERDYASVTLVPQYDWIVEEFERCRKLLKGG